MKAAVVDLYWRLCQYPWYLIFNAGFGGLVYLTSLITGPRLARIFLRSRPAAGVYPIKYFILDRLATSFVATSLAGILALIFIYQNGVGFALFGFNYFYWFLFLPFHLLVYSMRHRAAHGRIEILKILVALGLLWIFYLSTFYFPGHIIVRFSRFEVRQISVPLRILHLSDIHCERFGEREARIKAIVNSLKPDLVLITGDIYNAPEEYNRRGLAAARKLLSGINARYGIWAVSGHHDIFYNDPPLSGDQAGGMEYLNNAVAGIVDSGINVSLTGVKTYNRDWYYPRDTVPGAFRIFLAHRPAWIEHLQPGDFDLALFGHTHAEQVYLPLVDRLVLGQYIHGWYRKNNTRIYVHSGLGMDGFLSPRVRWFTYPEIVVIDLIPEEK